ncbi:uncharacterized protein MEPE_01509 [Melanopsichium pennsylvanicum]|uniref:Uncharacterized protein n=2 Tax=Melanopsichium pennsylvanicum TaxID=63383 RepID=A0AAJ4XIL7_9BASI|nr:conserved hypothetical protein [Melanopsichium pennsylvanicum 4]SNX82803.1 uncharacterized protein MEPE_01509 [Melanopsichium pennsylvanicum]
MIASPSFKRKSSLSIASLAPLGAIATMLSPWGLPMLKALLLEPIRINPPVWLRVLLGLLFVTNIRSIPFLWHIRVLYPAFKAVVQARTWFSSPKSNLLTHSAIQPQLKLERLPIGKDIFADISSYNFIATLDECDWNGHLSNSSYSRSLDHTRMAHNSPRFLKMYYDGGWVALGGSGFSFHREIPMLARYTIHMSLEAWDDKWVYIVGRFVAPANPNKAAANAATAAQPANAATEMLQPGEILYCTSTSRYVCKAGRRTIPPWLMIATSGYGTTPATRSNWEKAEKLRVYYLEKERKAYLDKTAKQSISAKVQSKLVKKSALLRQFRTESERQGTQEEAWMSKAYWEIDEWETRRKRGLDRLGVSVGILPALEK